MLITAGRFDMDGLLRKYDMRPHEENGSYSECHYPYTGEGRAPSGSSYFYTSPGERTLFHTIDCDEYWCYNAGSPVEVWVIDGGRLEIKKLGITEDAEPVIYFPKGVIFGSRNTDPDGEGTFFTCVTVPRFSYEGFRLVDRDELTEICPQTSSFWED